MTRAYKIQVRQIGRREWDWRLVEEGEFRLVFNHGYGPTREKAIKRARQRIEILEKENGPWEDVE